MLSGGGLRSEHHIHVIIHPASIDLPSHLMKKKMILRYLSIIKMKKLDSYEKNTGSAHGNVVMSGWDIYTF